MGSKLSNCHSSLNSLPLEEFPGVQLLTMVSQKSSNSRMYVNIRMRNLILPALIDSGAECGIVFNSKLFYELQREGGIRLEPTHGTIGVANGGSAEITGKCWPIVYLGNAKWKGLALLVKNLPYSAIIGFHFLQDIGAEIHFGRRQLLVGGNTVDEVPEAQTAFSAACMDAIGNVDCQGEEDFPDPLLEPFDEPVDLEISHPKVSREQAVEFREFVDCWRQKFNANSGISNALAMKLYVDPSMPPVKQRYFPLSPPMQKIAGEQVDKLLKAGLIVPSTSPWSSPAFLLRKKNNDWRLTVDYREVNKACRKNAYPLPRIQETLDRLKGSFFVSNLDLMIAR